MHILPIIAAVIFVCFIMYMLQTAPFPIPAWVRWILVLIVGLLLLDWVCGLMGVSIGLPLHL